MASPRSAAALGRYNVLKPYLALWKGDIKLFDEETLPPASPRIEQCRARARQPQQVGLKPQDVLRNLRWFRALDETQLLQLARCPRCHSS